MREKLRIVNVLDLDENAVELTCNTMVTENKGFDIAKTIRGDILHMRKTMIEGTPKVFKIVIPYHFYKDKQLNIREYIDIEVKI